MGGLLGLSRTARAEAPSAAISHLDGSGIAISELMAVASALPKSEPELTFARTKAQVPRLQRLAALPEEPEQASGAQQLLSGGTGGLGLLTGRWLGETGAASLVLAARGGKVAAADAAKLKKLPECVVRVVRCDAAERTDTRCVLAAMLCDGGARLAGAWHAAGVLSDGLLHSQTAQTFKRVFAPKAFGGWSLQAACASAPLQAMVFFSSVAALLGGAGQSNYAAANCCLDATSAMRRAYGQAASSVQWGPWADVGMASEGSINARLQAMGIGLISMAEGVSAFKAAMAMGGPACRPCTLSSGASSSAA